MIARLVRLLRLGAGVAVLSVLLSRPASAMEIRGGTVTVGPGEIVADDLYASGPTVTVQGTVDGDLVVAAGTLRIVGTVTGDVLAVVGSLEVSGTVGGSVRAAAGRIAVSGSVDRDLVAAASTVTLTASGRIGRDAILTASRTAVVGEVGRDLVVGAGDLVVGGHVRRHLVAEVQDLTIQSGATVDGTITYRSPQAARVEPGATLTGPVQALTPNTAITPLRRGLETALMLLRRFLGLVVLGLLFVWLFPEPVRRGLGLLRDRPLPSLGLGLLVAVLGPVVALLLGLVGLVTGGWWLGLLAFGLYILGLLLGYLLGAIFLGSRLLRPFGPRPPLWLALLLGLLILMILTLVPYADVIITVLVGLLGLGALLQVIWAGGRSPASAAPDR